MHTRWLFFRSSWLVIAFACFLYVTTGWAQSTSTITGIVTDPSGAVIQGADVVCTNEATHLALRTVANGNGLFRLPDVPVGSYQLSVSHPGFAKLVRNGIELLTEHTVDLNLVLQVGEASQSVLVDAPAPLVQATTSDVQTTITSRQMAELPLNGRNAFQLAVLVPGAVQTEASTTVGQQDNTGLSVNGLRPADLNWQLDGGTYVNKNYGSAPTLPNPDTLQEFTTVTSNYSAQERGAGGVVKLTTRSGSNQFHGTVFEFLRNDALDTRNFFSVDVERYKQSQYGGTAGGPIRKNRLFFFGSYQGTKKRGSPSPISATVPSVDQHNGDFSKSGHTIIDPKSNQPFPNDIIPKDRWDPVGAKVLSYLPLGNLGPNTLVSPPPANKDDSQFMVKIDYVIGSKDHLSGRYFRDQNSYQRDITSYPGFYGQDRFRNQTLLVAWTHTFCPTWVMENTFNLLRTYRTELPVAPVYTSDLGVNVPPAQADIPYPQILITLSGYQRLYSSRTVIINPMTAEYQGSVSHPVGAHFIRFGGTVRNNRQSTINVGDPFGAWTFSAQRTNASAIRNSGDAIASLLLSAPQTFAESAAPATQLFLSSLFDLWVQDDWKVSRRFTVNLGLRYDPWIPAHDDTGIVAGFLPGAHSTIAPKAPAGVVFSGDPGIPASVMHAHWNEFGPRAGFAWDTGGNGSTIVRGGYGIFQMGAEAFSMLRNRVATTPTRSLSISISAPPSTGNPYAGYPGGAPFPFRALTPSQIANYVFPANLTLDTFDPTYNPGYTQSWNLTIERKLREDTAASLAYVGNHFLGSIDLLDYNAAVYGPGATLANEQARRPYPGLGLVTVGTGYNHGAYHGLQAQITKRPTRGLLLLANYTFSKVLDLNASSQNGGTVGDLPRNPYNANLDKGPADFDIRHSLKATAVYDLPKLASGSRLVRALANDWQINTIVTARTGAPLTCRSGGDNSLSGVGGDTCDQVLPNTARPVGADPLTQWFNTAAFTTNAPGTFGNTGRGILRRPGAFDADVSLFKRIPVTERLLGELRVEVFNALNHPNFDLIYNTSSTNYAVNGANFGKVIHAGDPRLIQLALKLRF